MEVVQGEQANIKQKKGARKAVAKIKSYNFWIKLISLVILLIRIVLTEFGFSIDTTVIVDIVTLVAGVMVLCGIIKDPTKSNKKENTIMFGNEKMKEDILNEINNMELQGDAAASAALNKIKKLLINEADNENGEVAACGEGENLPENNLDAPPASDVVREEVVETETGQQDAREETCDNETVAGKEVEACLVRDANENLVLDACPREVIIGAENEINESGREQNENSETDLVAAPCIAATGEAFINKCINNSEAPKQGELLLGGEDEQPFAETTFAGGEIETTFAGGDKAELSGDAEINENETQGADMSAENDGDSEARELLKEKVKAFLLNNLDELISSLG